MSATSEAPGRRPGRRGKPIAVLGHVSVLAPSGSGPYYRLTWTKPDGTPGPTSGGRTREGAQGKATALDSDLGRAAGGKAMVSLAGIVEDYLSSPIGRNGKTGGDWDQTQLEQMKPKLARVIRGHQERQAMEVDRPLLDIMRFKAGTRRTRKENATTLRGLLRWGAQQAYFSPRRRISCPHSCTTWSATSSGQRRRSAASTSAPPVATNPTRTGAATNRGAWAKPASGGSEGARLPACFQFQMR